MGQLASLASAIKLPALYTKSATRMAESNVDTHRKFETLPTEIRLMIWERALPGPRVVHLRQRMKIRHTLIEVLEDCQPPNILLVCKEAYEVVSQSPFYHKAISPHPSMPTRFWFGFEVDTLYLRHDKFSDHYNDESLFTVTHNIGNCAFSILRSNNLLKVKNIALLLPKHKDPIMPLEKSIAKLASTIGGLERLYLVVKHYGMGYQLGTCCSIADPIDVEETIKSYEWFAWRASHQKVWWEDIPKEAALDCTGAEVNLMELQKILAKDVNTGKNSWKIPRIEPKVVIDAGYAAKLAAAKGSAQMEVRKQRYVNSSKSPNPAEL